MFTTVRSVSQDGVYYLVNGWKKHRAFWVRRENLRPEIGFKNSGYAIRSLRKLLIAMPEYRSDRFDMVTIENGQEVSVYEISTACAFYNETQESEIITRLMKISDRLPKDIYGPAEKIEASDLRDMLYMDAEGLVLDLGSLTWEPIPYSLQTYIDRTIDKIKALCGLN